MKILYFLCACFLFTNTTLLFANCCIDDDCCTPVSIYCPPTWGNIFVTGAYLNWKAREDGLAYAITGLKTSGNTPPLAKGETKNLSWDRNSGYRVGLGYIFPCLCWDLYLNYTRFNTHASGETHVPLNAQGQATLWEVWGAPAGGTFITDASGKWNLKFQSLDLEAGRTFVFKNCYTLRPFGGLEAIWTKNNYDILYQFFPFFQDIHNDQHFSGIGPRIGLANNWNIIKYVSLFADGAFSLLCGNYSISRKDIVQTQVGNAAVWVDTGDHFSTVRPVIDLSVGVRLDACFCDRVRIFTKFAYENLIFIHYNQLMRFTEGDINIVSDTNMGNFWNCNSSLVLGGLTITAGILF